MTVAVSNDLMRRSDEAEIRSGTSSLELMRRAGVAIWESYEWQGQATQGKTVFQSPQANALQSIR